MLNSLMWKISRRKSGFAQRLSEAAELYIDYYNDFGYEFEKNGERRLLERLTQHNVSVVFDVGANVGDWSLIATGIFPNAKIHCFELSPRTFQQLQTNLKLVPNCALNNCGLGENIGEISYKDYGPEQSTLNTITNTTYHDTRFTFSIEKARIETGDRYIETNNIPTIDLLKIDVEGAEHLVLRGFLKALQTKRVRVIQFEYGYANGDAKFLMKDFYEFLGGLGYEIGKLRSDGVSFTKFDYCMNNFQSGPNYLAVLKSEVDLIRSLGGR